MADGSTPNSKKLLKLKEMSFALGPPKPGRWRVSFRRDSSSSSLEGQPPAPPPEAGIATKDSEPASAGTSLDNSGQHFATRLQLILNYRREVATLARATSFANSVSIFALLSEIAAASRNRDEADALASFAFDVLFEDEDGRSHQFLAAGPIYEQHHYKAVADRAKYHDAALRLLYETSVQQLVSAYERLIGDIARSHIFENAQVAAKDQSLTYRQILELGSLDEVKRAVVEAQVKNLIRNSDTLEQLKWLHERLNVDVRSHFSDIGAFRGLELRRHAIVHAGGIATSEYLRRLAALGESETATEGTPLELSSAYIERAWDVVYSLGIVTVHLASVARARGLGDGEQVVQADGRLNEAAFWAIQQERHRAAQKILEYAQKLRLSNTTDQLMVIVNLAQTYKWQGREKDCQDLLCAHDWEATNDRFCLCVAVLKDENAEQYLERAVKGGHIRLADLYQWPVFSRFRELDEFPAVVERVFGPDARPPLEKFPASLLTNVSHEETLRKLFEHFRGLSERVAESNQPADGVDDESVH